MRNRGWEELRLGGLWIVFWRCSLKSPTGGTPLIFHDVSHGTYFRQAGASRVLIGLRSRLSDRSKRSERDGAVQWRKRLSWHVPWLQMRRMCAYHQLSQLEPPEADFPIVTVLWRRKFSTCAAKRERKRVTLD